MREIGSEFWKEADRVDDRHMELKDGDRALLLSGRGAIEFMIQDMKKEGTFQSILLPLYCCDSMIEPFQRNGVKVEFYQVGQDHLEYRFPNTCDAVLVIDYFGYKNKGMEEIAEKEKKAGKTIIYDATHKINGHPEIERYADYFFCSYRKWFYCNYAVLRKYKGKFAVPKPVLYFKEYCSLREKAASLKALYMKGMDIDKKEFLHLFERAEKMLEENDKGYVGEEILPDLDKMLAKRRENAAYLIEKLKGLPEIRVWSATLEENDAPLFVPIMVQAGIRDKLRKHLIENNIFCPVHWPVSPLHAMGDMSNDLFQVELSLICDQRYCLEDMEKEFQVIKSFYGECGV